MFGAVKHCFVYLAVGLFLFTSNGYALDVTGTVTDAETQKPIESVLVQIKGTTQKAYTSAQGNFVISQGFTGMVAVPRVPGIFMNTMPVTGQALFTIEGKQVNRSLQAIPDGMYLLWQYNQGNVSWARVIKAGNVLNTQYAANIKSTSQKTAAGPITIEAETMTLNNYIPDTDSRLTGKTIMVDPQLGVPATGTALTTFTGQSGYYSLTVTVVPENDGASGIKLYAGSSKILDEIIPLDPDGYTLAVRKDYTVDGVVLNNGDQLKIEGTSDGAAFARIDKIVISDGKDVTLVLAHNDYVEKEVAARLGGSINISLTPRPKAGEKPGPGNTGYTGTLTPYTGPMRITTPGTVIENVSITGCLNLDADNITVRNFKIDAQMTYYGIKYLSGTGHLVEDGEITNCKSAGIIGAHMTVRRCNIHDNNGDGVKMGSNTLVEGCWIHRLGMSEGAHADGNQSRSGNNITFRGNNINMPIPGSPGYYPDAGGQVYKSNSMFFMSGAVSPLSNVLLEGNWLNGGNFTIYSGDGGWSRVINNKFGRDYRYGIHTGNPAEWSGNVWEDNGQPCP